MFGATRAIVLASGVALALAAGLATLMIAVPRTAPPAALGSPAPTDAAPTASPAAYTDDPAVDELIRSLLNDDAAALEARFGGVTARAGALLGGPIGLLQPREVPSSEWTALLGAAERSLHAVVKDPREPFEWWDQPAPGFPRAAVFAEWRDFDVVLIVGLSGPDPRPWRFSIEERRVIDVVIDGGEAPDDVRPLVRKLGYLTPSPDREPESFLVIPPHEMRPPPPGIGMSTGNVPPAPVSSPSLAPDGRTGDADIDALIDGLLRGDLATLTAKYGELPAREERCDPSCDGVRIAPDTWIARLVGGRPSLYAVYTGDPVDAEVMLAVRGSGDILEAWRLSVETGRIAHLEIFLPSADWPSGMPILNYGRMPSPMHDYERYYVLPPADDLPEPPRIHAPSARTGVASVDDLLAALERRDAAFLLGRFADRSAFPVRPCDRPEEVQGAAFAEAWSKQTVADLYGLHAVAIVPAGHQPEADHLVVTFRQIKPYWWAATGIFERQGEIVGVITAEHGCSVEVIAPAGRYVVAPPTGGVSGIDPSRRSGIAVIDAVLDAAEARDEAAMDALIEYTRDPCGDPSGAPPGAGPPACPPGTTPGTLVEILPEIVCHGGHAERDRAARAVIEWMKLDRPSGLYAVVEATSPGGRNDSPDTRYLAVIASRDGPAVTLSIGERGVSRIDASCGPAHPEARIGGPPPSYLLPPP
ncbi:MAG: hypothetical protein ACRDGT_02040 [Candidatus Limnocylindria bacterium]